MDSKYLAAEDDCAPDASEFFNQQLLEITGHTKKEFIQDGFELSLDNGNVKLYKLDGYIIEWSIDDPYWALSKE